VELSGYLVVARRWWWTLLVATWIAGLVGFVAATRITPTYESRTSLLVGPIQADIDTLRASGQLVQTYAELVTSQPLLESAISELGLAMKPSELRQSTRAVANDVTRFLTIRVQSADPGEAQRIATTLADELVQLASRGTSRPEGELLVADPANLPTNPIAPQVSLIALLSAVAGLIGALVIVMLVEYFSNRIRAREDLQRLTGRPVLGVMTLAEVPTAAPIVARTPGGGAAARYRLLAARLAGSGDRRPDTIVMTGTEAGEDVGEVALNVALALHQAGRSVALVDAVGGPTSVSATIGAADAPGFAGTVASGGALPADGLVTYEGIAVLPAGRAAAPVSLDDASVARLLATLRGRADVVVVAAAAVAADAGALVLARNASATVLVARRDVSRREAVGLAVETLLQAGATLAGSVLLEGPGRRARRSGARAAGTKPTDASPDAVEAAALARRLAGTPGTVRPPVTTVERSRAPDADADRRPTSRPRAVRPAASIPAADPAPGPRRASARRRPADAAGGTSNPPG